MKIAMMTPWNVSCGVATHAELIGHEWVRMGHELNVLAPIERESQPVTNRDEPYVTRCYTMDREFIKGILKPLSLDLRPFLDLDYELLIVQNLELMPMLTNSCPASSSRLRGIEKYISSPQRLTRPLIGSASQIA